MENHSFRVSVSSGPGNAMLSAIRRRVIGLCLLGAMCLLVVTGSSCRKGSKEQGGGQTASETTAKASAESSAQEANSVPALGEAKVNETAREPGAATAPAAPQKASGDFAKLLDEASKHRGTEEPSEESAEQTEESAKDPLAEWAAAGDTDSKLEVLDDLGFSGASREDVIAVVGKALEDSSPEVRQAAAEMLEDSGGGEGFGAEAETGPGDARVVDLISRALMDENEDVRSAAMSAAEEQGAAEKLKLFDAAMGSPYNDVKLEAVSELSDMSSPAAMDVLIKGLKDGNAEVREEISSAIDFLVDEQFDNYKQAEKWWKANRNRYDEDLNEKDGSD